MQTIGSMQQQQPGGQPAGEQPGAESSAGETASADTGEEAKEEKDKKHHLVECSYGSFMRSFTLPTGAKAEMVSADFKDGVLKITVPKTEEGKSSQVEIKIK